ncbi:MAG: Holliday junction branch migration protein RuvA [Anaerosomatales bacterium]|nr:Holliday junction branch migration protein RuvA [Anaerosomatales bacterium]
MIAFVTGTVVAKTADRCIVDIGGVGLSIAMSTASIAALPADGDEVTIHTHLHVREDELSLFGFESLEEKALFERLITVSGVGPRVALAALSAYRPEMLVRAVAEEDVALVSSVPGIGKKTAQRIILELKDRLGAPDLGETARRVGADTLTETREALASMGFTPAEIAAALKDAGDAGDANALLKHALKRLGGAS